MTTDIEKTYNHVRSGRTGFYEQKRGLIAVWGKEAVQFLDGMISNDMKTLEDGRQMLAAFPNAQGRLLAMRSALRSGHVQRDGLGHEKKFSTICFDLRLPEIFSSKTFQRHTTALRFLEILATLTVKAR
jgi:hypothetical protein